MDERLIAVAQQIRCAVHVDVGSDHAQLLVALLKSGRIGRGIAIENKSQPHENSRQALANHAADVRMGNGLEPLEPGEADSLSICGMGAQSIVRILEAFPDRVPNKVIIQANRQSELVRQWALRSNFHLSEEQTVFGHWPYQIITFVRSDQTSDPAYDGVDAQAALLFGPLNLRRADSKLKDDLLQARAYFSAFKQLEPKQKRRLEAIETALRDHWPVAGLKHSN